MTTIMMSQAFSCLLRSLPSWPWWICTGICQAPFSTMTVGWWNIAWPHSCNTWFALSKDYRAKVKNGVDTSATVPWPSAKHSRPLPFLACDFDQSVYTMCTSCGAGGLVGFPAATCIALKVCRQWPGQIHHGRLGGLRKSVPSSQGIYQAVCASPPTANAWGSTLHACCICLLNKCCQAHNWQWS